MSSNLSLGTAKLLLALLVAIAVVLAAGLAVGQAPALFGVEEEPEASITFSDQTTNGSSVEVESVTLSDGGFIVITNSADETVAVSDRLDAGPHENVTIEQDDENGGDLVGQLTATVHQDTANEGTYMFEESDREEDRPYIEDGYPVSDTASVTLNESEGDTPTDSFQVESLSLPTTATTNETVTVEGEIRNPRDVENRQRVEIRVDGEVLERKIVSLEAEETTTVSFELETASLEPGDRTVGIYTTDHGQLDTLTIQYETPPELELVEANESTATVNVTLPEDGFLTVENESQAVRGISENLSAGTHENIPLEFDAEGEETLFVVLYSGEPDEYDEEEGFPNADPIVVDGDRIRAALPSDDDRVRENDS
ncbi:DUF4179 domain-containing protein [Saliphagus sp. GCM10025317]